MASGKVARAKTGAKVAKAKAPAPAPTVQELTSQVSVLKKQLANPNPNPNPSPSPSPSPNPDPNPNPNPNPNQELSFKFGCTQTSAGGYMDVSSCATACMGSGCCGIIHGCDGSACVGGGCCDASQTICLAGCHVYLGVYPPPSAPPSPPAPPAPPSPPPPPSTPPLAPCYDGGVYVYSDGNPYGKDQWHMPVSHRGGSSLLQNDAGIGTNNHGLIAGITRVACLAKLRDDWAS